MPVTHISGVDRLAAAFDFADGGHRVHSGKGIAPNTPIGRIALERRKDRLVTAVGPVLNLLRDSHPHNLAFNVNPETTPSPIQELVDRWRTIRESLSLVEAGDPDVQVRNEPEPLSFKSQHR